MAQNPQQTNSNAANYPYNMYQNPYYQYPYYQSQYNSYPNTIQAKTNKIDTPLPPGVSPPGISPPGISTSRITPPGISPPGISPPGISPPGISPPGISPPGISPHGISPPGVTNFSSQPSPPGTSVTQNSLQTQPGYQIYSTYPYSYYYQQPYTNNPYTNPQTQTSFQPQPPPPPQQAPPPTYPPKTAPEPPSSIQSLPSINTTNKEKSLNNNNNNNNNNKSYNQITYNTDTISNNKFTPDYISVQVEAIKNRIEKNKQKEEMKKKEEEYPQSLKDYITKCYKICPKDKRDVLETELKSLITDAKLRNALFTIRWENMGLPAKCLDNPKSIENIVVSNNVLTNKNKRRFMDTSNSPSPYSSSSMEMDESLMGLSEKERIEEIKRRKRRMERFNDDYSAEMKKRQEKEVLNRQAEITKQMYINQNGNPDVVDWDQDTLVGTCQDLEKNYLRLTSAPDPATVRPLPVLRKTLKLLKEKWTKEQNYNYICDQFKSLRQDLTVQRIKNEFTVEVYEIHARIALEKGDLGEYNQCQSQLKQLYKLGLKGHEIEFLAYRLLYYVHTLNPKDMNSLISELTPEQRIHPFIKHALDVRTAVANGNYHKFFELYMDPPDNMAIYLMDHFVERERIKALKVMTKAYLTLSIPFIADELGFDTDEECIKLLKSVRCPIKKDKNKEYIIQGKIAHPIFNKKWQEITKKGIDIKGQI